jgi:predicted O-methyltransferase YrrM
MSITEKLQTLLWWAKRPKLYPQTIHILTRKILHKFRAQEDTKELMESWCAERALDTQTALTQLTGITSFTSVDRLFADQFEHAEKIAKACPVEMGGPGDLDLLYWCAEYLKASKVIETGVAYGWSSLAILFSLKNRKDSRLVSTDMPYPNKNNDSYVGCVVPEELRLNWNIIRYADRQALPKALNSLGQIDMCHYDSDKSYYGRMWAYPILWNALKPGGFFMSDDIGDNVAFRDFASAIKANPIVVSKDEKYIGIIVKQ